jgi:hypothetical protein
MGMSSEMERLADLVRLSYPEAKRKLIRPRNPGGVWSLFVVHDDYELSVEWRPGKGFAVSARSDAVFGEAPDELYCDFTATAVRVLDLLRRKGRTEPQSAKKATLRELRAERQFSQVQLAEKLRVPQSCVSRYEHHAGRMNLSTLNGFIASLGGELVIHARFPGGIVRTVDVGDEGGADDAETAAALAEE